MRTATVAPLVATNEERLNNYEVFVVHAGLTVGFKVFNLLTSTKTEIQ